MKKKVLAAMICVSMLFSYGCGASGSQLDAPNTAQPTQEEAQVTQPPVEETSQEEAGDEETSNDKTQLSDFEIPEVNIAPSAIPDNAALAFVHDMKIGWNLGNTLDAFNDSEVNELKIESSWCGIKTTKEMIDDIHAAGFNTIRVPVSWHNHVDEEFNISEIWMDRVEEVVNYGLDNGMYVIINIHHDCREECFYPDYAHLDTSKQYVKRIWEQIAERFGEYDEHLIFENLNEPRLVGHPNEWWIDNANQDCIDAIDCINQLNQVFMDVVRGSDHEMNRNRYVMISGYDASPDGALHSNFVLPQDTAENKMIVSIHAYTPYNFALDLSGTDYFDSDAEFSVRDIDYFMKRLYDKYVSQGTPVVIGEFGALNKQNNTQARVDYATYYIAAARAKGITCVWWDNNNLTGSGEQFCLYYRKGRSFVYPDIITGLMKYAD